MQAQQAKGKNGIAWVEDKHTAKSHGATGTDPFFFFSSRRRHTRSLCDWNSDVCSSDLRSARRAVPRRAEGRPRGPGAARHRFRSEERRVGKGVDLGGRRIIKKKKKK